MIFLNYIKTFVNIKNIIGIINYQILSFKRNVGRFCLCVLFCSSIFAVILSPECQKNSTNMILFTALLFPLFFSKSTVKLSKKFSHAKNLLNSKDFSETKEFSVHLTLRFSQSRLVLFVSFRLKLSLLEFPLPPKQYGQTSRLIFYKHWSTLKHRPVTRIT